MSCNKENYKMINQIKVGLLTLVGVVLLGLFPPGAQAAKIHAFNCVDCHKAPSAANPRAMGNLCVNCHSTAGSTTAKFSKGAASDAMNHNPWAITGAGEETSHFWGGNSTLQAAAGSANPSSAFYTSRYAISTNRITCTICHDPHGEAGTKLVRAATDNDLICQQCHGSWFVNSPDAELTHPIVADYAATAAAANAAAAAAGEPQDPFKLTIDNSLAGGGNGSIRLVNNGTSDGVTCTSCHGVHFTDSDSTTADTKENYAGLLLSAGDGKILRSDGATRANKSALCQACHNYRPHGDSGTKHSITGNGGITATTTVGCLECHSGHSYNNGNVQFYVLRDQIGAPYNVTFTAPYDYSAKPASHDQVSPWQDGAGANGYCEKCHGDASLLGGSQHTNTAKCMTCHFHNSSPAGYSFEPGANVAICGDCHGFPPHINARGDRATNPSYEGGYAYVSAANNYTLASSFKDESNTPHNAHAAGGVFYSDNVTPQGIDSDYRMGDSEVACSTCHGIRPNHNTGSTTVLGTYEDLDFDSRAAVDGQAAPAYDGAGRETCNNIYCHSNGGRRAGDNPTEATRVWSFIETPYTGGGTASGWKNGKGTLITALPALGSASECSACHGNTDATMTTRGNSASHNKHLTANYACNVCHVYTATTNISVPKVARDISKNAADPTKGTHVNQKVEVKFDPAVTPAIGSGTYSASAGTCNVYCHSDGAGGPPVTTADWDVTGSDCKYCHKSNVASGVAMSSGSHTQHINGTVATIGRQMGCVECHSTTVSNDTTVSTPANHVNGVPTWGIQSDANQASCNNIKCHSNGNIDGTITYKANGVDYVWGTNNTIGCTNCHGNGIVAYPTYANGGIGNNSNSHLPHSDIACGECHASVSTAGTSINGTTPTNHVNMTIDVSGAKFGWTAGTETCSAITCHGGGTAQWGATALACGSCHQNATTDTDDFTYGNATQAVIATNEWSFSGHGKTTGTYEVTGRSAANFPGAAPSGDACKFCHDGSVTHNDANYFRLRQNGKADLNGACLGCHETGAAGVDPDAAGTAYNLKNATVKINKYHQGAKHGDPRDGGRWCWDCHDPHGDASAAGSRIQMIQKRAQVNPNTYGVPASLTSTDIVFTSRTIGAGAGGFARDITGAGAAAGLCNACHTTTSQYTNATGVVLHSTALCTTCHQHNADNVYDGNAFQGSGCNGCHGSTGNGQYWPDGVGGSPAYVDNSAGSATTHNNHITAIGVYLGYGNWATTMYNDAQQKAICSFCHATPGAAGHDTNGGGDSIVDVLGAGQFTKFTGVGATATDSGSGAYAAGSCATSACHNGVATPASWNTPPAANCTTLCHGPNTTATAREGHQDHVVSKGYACTECHVNNGTNYGHINGEVNLVFTNVGSIEQTYGAGDGSYSQAANSVPRDGVYGNCANMACHANKLTPNWNLTITPTGCNDCHTVGGASLNPNSGLHTGATPTVSGVKHDDTITGGCAACHTVGALSSHVNGIFTGNGSSGPDRTNMGLIAGFTTSGTDNTGTCSGGTVSGASCHPGGDSGTWARKWDSSIHYVSNGTECKGCHGGFGESDWTFGSVSNITDGSVEHNRDWDADATSGEVIGEHKDNVGNTTRCNICHVYNDTGYTYGTNHRNGSIEMNSSMGYSATTWNCASSCHANNTNHNLEDSGWTVAAVAGPALSCYTCHGNGSTQYWPGGASFPNRAGEHQAHITALAAKLAITLPGTDAEQKRMCEYCHNDATGVGGSGHDASAAAPADVGGINPIWDITNPPMVTDTGASVVSGSCSSIDCHNNIATTPTYDWYAGAATACVMCHSTGAADATHVAHTGGGYGKTIDCLSCHGAGTTTTTAPTAGHISGGAITVAGNVTFTYTGGLTGTCGTNDCHNDGTLAKGAPYSSGAALGAYAWGTPLTNCTACHNNPNATGNGGARHTKHMANTTYVPAGCTECHTAGTAATHINGTINATGTKQSAYSAVNGTCTNTCHTATVANGVWTDALALPCVNCHQAGTYVGSGANLPTSGLHNVSVALKHDATLQSGNCINCHAAIPTTVATDHINGGALQNATAITYAWNANVVSYVPATGCQAAIACHTDGGDWRRKWAGVTDAKPLATDNPGAAVCGNCHGDTVVGWRWNEVNGTTTDHTDPNNSSTDNVTPTHGGCQNCHGWGAAGYNKTWLGSSNATYYGHGDAYITMNGPAPTTGAAYDNVTGGCAQACHANSATYQMNTNSGWTANYGDYGAGSCFTCHGNGTNQYWPDGAVYPDKAGRHTIHITRLAAKLAITLPGTDLEQKRMCEYCHNDATGVGGSSHMTNSAPTDVADVGAINPIWSAGNPPSTADAGSAFNTTDGSCASIDCHNNKTAPAATFGWRDATTTTCTMCHTAGGVSNDPTSGLHNLTPTVSGQRHDNTITGGCAACHTSVPTPGSGTHVNGAFTGNGTIAGDKTNMGLITAYTATADGTGSCLGSPTGNAGCHSGAGDAGTWARKWDSTISGLSNGTECKGCHGGFAETDWTFGSVSNITDGSVEHNRSWDGDGTTGEVIGNHKDDLANTSRCNVCHIYGDAGYVFGTNHRNGQLEMNSTRGYSNTTWNCTSTCHISNTGKNLETSGWTINAVAGPALACDSCHGGSGQYWPNNVSTAVGDYPNRKGRHDIHMTRLAAKLGYTLPGTDVQQKAMCDYCHNDGTGSGGTGHDTDRTAPSNVGGFNHIGTGTADANGAYNSTAPGTCTTNDCHNNQATVAGTYGWYDSTSSACLMCHALGGTNGPTSGLHNVLPTVSGAAFRHDDSFSTGGTCISCHTTLPTAGPTTHVNGTFTGNGTIAGDKTNMGLFTAYTATADNIGTCVGSPTGNAGCHAGTGDAGTWARVWNSTVSNQTNGTECKGCHGGFAGTDWTFGSTHNISDGSTEHQYNWDGDANTSEVIGNHKDNAANTTRCNTCHVYADAPYGTLATYHRNGTIEMNSTVEYSTSNFNCTGACHAANNTNHNLDTSGWTVNPIAGAALACYSCHGGGTAQTGGAGFNYWPDGTIYPDNTNGTRHLSHITKLAARLGFTMGTLTDAQQKQMCSYCHDNVGGVGHNDATAPADTNFHPFWDATNPASVVDSGASFADATGVCSNIDCHNNKTTLDNTYDWNAAGTTACVMCHTAGGGTNDPISGLHSGTFTVANSAHDDSFATGGTCASCHTIPAVAVGSSHINGTFSSNATIAGDKTNMGLSTTYTALTTTNNGTGTCSGAGVAGTCHGAAGTTFDGGSWARKWDSNLAGKTDGTECSACHGGFNNDWTFDQTTVIANNTRHAFDYDGNNGAEIMGNHSNNASQLTKCNICHVYGDAGYTLATNHRDGKISMNSSTTYSGTTWNCTAVCHVSNVNHALTASSSIVAGTRVGAVAGPALACYTCHGGGTANSGSSFNYWPDGTAYPDKESTPNRHLAHITKLAAKLNYNMATLTDQQQKTMCGYCHPYTTSPGEANHNDNVSPADVTTAAFNPLWSTITTNYPSTADNATVAATWTTGTQQCSGIDCHNNQATTGTWAWNSTGTGTCLLCHTLGGAGSNPTSGLHNVTPTVSGQRHDDAFGASGTCISCHTTLPAVAPTSTHINGTFTGNGTIAGDKTNMGLFAAYTATANDIGTCSNSGGAGVASAACHGDGVAAAQKGDAGTWKRIWNSTINAGTGGAECANCHGGFSGSDWTFGVTSGAANTGDTTTDHMANYDGDGLSNEVSGNHSGTTQATRCINCHVYGDSNYVWATNHRNNTIEVNSATGMTTVNRTCTTFCHVSNTGHVLDAGGWTVGTLSSPVVCTTCHAAITTHTDADGPGATYPTAGGNFCLDCHTSHATETFRTGVNASNNVYISTISARVVVGGANDTGTAIPTMDDQYASHDSYIQLGGNATTSYAKSTEAEMCWACHDAVTASAYTLSGVSVTFTNTSTTVGTIAATGIGSKFAVGRWITISGSTVVANNRTFKVATSTANSITVTINAGDGPLSTVTNATGVVIVSPLSEWQVNEKAATGTLPYNYGMLFTDASTVPGTKTSNWTTGFWRSGKGQQGGSAYNPAWYKRGAIQSTHSANIGGTFTAAVSAGNTLGYNRTETKDAVANIRCSYCHDVHGTHDGVNGDVAGSPYLRGTWKGNPYNEDMAPQYGMSNWSILANYGVVPRASAATTNSGLATVAKAGAYWIDQNSGNPNSGSSSTLTAGLCDQCHSATKNGTWTAAEIGAIDQVASEALWTSGYNGHANSVISGAGGDNGTAPAAASAERRARNIFTRTLRGSATLTDSDATQATMNMGAVGVGQGYSYRGAGSGYTWYPRAMNTTELGTTAGRPLTFSSFAWSAATPALTQDVTIGAEVAHDAQLNFHTFNCAKCHNPHASRLPKLMITNCLDANHNTWEDKSTFTGTALPAPWTGLRHSQWATAQNCHRLDSRAVLATGQVITMGKGWNKATPWQEIAAPNTTIATDPNP